MLVTIWELGEAVGSVLGDKAANRIATINIVFIVR
jgi:hypothetical protein